MGKHHLFKSKHTGPLTSHTFHQLAYQLESHSRLSSEEIPPSTILVYLPFFLESYISLRGLPSQRITDWVTEQKSVVSQFRRLQIRKCQLGWFLLKALGYVPCFLPGSWRLAGNLWRSLACSNITPVSASSSRGLLLVCISLCPNGHFLKGHQSYWVRATLLQADRTLTSDKVTF